MFKLSRLTQNEKHYELIEIGSAQLTQSQNMCELIEIAPAQSTQSQNMCELIEIANKDTIRKAIANTIASKEHLK